ncbi:MAG: PTS sugar transporter subunit IIA [Mycoplasmatales bacterium]
MGLFSGFSKKKEIEFLIPLSGEVVKLETVEDPVFSGKMMGDGFAINPTDGKIYSPVDGTVASIFPTGHAVGIKVDDNLDVLIHFGLDTVKLKGEGFTTHVKQGDVVKAGDLLIEVDIAVVKPQVPSIVTPIIFTTLEGKSFDVEYKVVVAKESGVVKIN